MKLAWSFILSLVVLTAIEGLVDVLDIAGSYPILVEVNDAWSRTSRGGNPLCFWASVVAVVAFAGVIGVATRPRDALLAVAFICANVVRDDLLAVVYRGRDHWGFLRAVGRSLRFDFSRVAVGCSLAAIGLAGAMAIRGVIERLRGTATFSTNGREPRRTTEARESRAGHTPMDLAFQSKILNYHRDRSNVPLGKRVVTVMVITMIALVPLELFYSICRGFSQHADIALFAYPAHLLQRRIEGAWDTIAVGISCGTLYALGILALSALDGWGPRAAFISFIAAMLVRDAFDAGFYRDPPLGLFLIQATSIGACLVAGGSGTVILVRRLSRRSG